MRISFINDFSIVYSRGTVKVWAWPVIYPQLNPLRWHDRQYCLGKIKPKISSRLRCLLKFLQNVLTDCLYIHQNQCWSVGATFEEILWNKSLVVHASNWTFLVYKDLYKPLFLESNCYLQLFHQKFYCLLGLKQLFEYSD